MRLIRFQRPYGWNDSMLDQWTNLREEINRLFDPTFEGLTPAHELFNGWAPPIDLYEDKDSLIVKAELPGMNKTDIDISLHDGTLTIAGERKNESENSAASRSERFFGRFARSFDLPKPVDPNKVKATYKDGILTVVLPKTEESKPKQIAVKAV